MKKVIYVVLIIVVAIVLTVILAGCTKNNPENTAVTIRSSDVEKEKAKNETSEDESEINYAEAAEKQMAKPEVGDTIAIIKVKGYGEMKFKFFNDVAPKAVENFITHSKEGYYDGGIFHRIINEFMIQGGDPEGTGFGGESIWGKGFGTELDKSLVPYRGSLCMAMSQQPNSIGSQFFITQANYDQSSVSYYKTNLKLSDELMEQYKTYGGALHLYMGYTVFGQMYEGFDILDEIAKVKTDENDKPLEDVIVEKITITEYK